MKKILLFLMLLSYALTIPVLADDLKTVEFPGESAVFNYTFNSLEDVITSDFVIKPTGITVLQIKFKSTSVDHIAILKLINKTTNEVIYNDYANFLTVNQLEGFDYPSEFIVYPYELKTDNEYYIELTSPSAANVSGEIEISGDIHKLSTLAKLYNMGIAQNVGQGPHQTLTRGEMTKILSQCLKMENGSYQTSFSDVPQNHIYLSNIGIIEQMGIAEGYGNGIFLPDNEITFYESVKMIVSALGYKTKAEIEGYPTGYLKIANELGITLYPGREDYKITLNGVGEMIYKALDAPLMQQVTYGKNPQYVIFDGVNTELKTIKTEYLGIKQ